MDNTLKINILKERYSIEELIITKEIKHLKAEKYMEDILRNIKSYSNREEVDNLKKVTYKEIEEHLDYIIYLIYNNYTSEEINNIDDILKPVDLFNCDDIKNYRLELKINGLNIFNILKRICETRISNEIEKKSKLYQL